MSLPSCHQRRVLMLWTRPLNSRRTKPGKRNMETRSALSWLIRSLPERCLRAVCVATAWIIWYRRRWHCDRSFPAEHIATRRLAAARDFSQIRPFPTRPSTVLAERSDSLSVSFSLLHSHSLPLSVLHVNHMSAAVNVSVVLHLASRLLSESQQMRHRRDAITRRTGKGSRRFNQAFVSFPGLTYHTAGRWNGFKKASLTCEVGKTRG